MGLFDSVYAGCPNCGARVEFQSKADEEPYMNNYTVEDAPTHILTDVLNEPHYCRKCGIWLALIDPAFPPHQDLPRPAPTVVRLRDPDDSELHIHPTQSELRRWNPPFSFADIAPAQGIEAGTDETLQAAQPEGQEPGG